MRREIISHVIIYSPCLSLFSTDWIWKVLLVSLQPNAQICAIRKCYKSQDVESSDTFLSACYILHVCTCMYASVLPAYSIMGEGEDQGIVPRFSKELYDRIEGTTEEQVGGLGCDLVNPCCEHMCTCSSSVQPQMWRIIIIMAVGHGYQVYETHALFSPFALPFLSSSSCPPPPLPPLPSPPLPSPPLPSPPLPSPPSPTPALPSPSSPPLPSLPSPPLPSPSLPPLPSPSLPLLLLPSPSPPSPPSALPLPSHSPDNLQCAGELLRDLQREDLRPPGLKQAEK